MRASSARLTLVFSGHLKLRCFFFFFLFFPSLGFHDLTVPFRDIFTPELYVREYVQVQYSFTWDPLRWKSPVYFVHVCICKHPSLALPIELRLGRWWKASQDDLKMLAMCGLQYEYN